MKKEWPYRLDPSSKKFHCPACGKKRFVRFIDQERNYLPIQFGRCDREQKCGYFYAPNYKDLKRSDDLPKKIPRTKSPLVRKEDDKGEPVFIPQALYEKTRAHPLESNDFLRNLFTNIPTPFPEYKVERVKELYKVGTITEGNWKGATCFPFIDGSGNIRFVQVKAFDISNHTTATNAFHSLIEKQWRRAGEPIPNWLNEYPGKRESKMDCLFGEHLLSKYPKNPVAVVEAPKTAIYCTLYFGEPGNSKKNPIWVAVGGLSFLSPERLSTLVNRKVVLYPDEGAYKVWKEKLEKILKSYPSLQARISSVLEKNRTNIDDGKDIADLLN